jgi:hypothetical protein
MRFCGIKSEPTLLRNSALLPPFHENPRPASRCRLSADDHGNAAESGGGNTQNKVLEIMDYGFFEKQAYRGTGGVRGSTTGRNRLATEPERRPLSPCAGLCYGPRSFVNLAVSPLRNKGSR